MQGLDHLRAGSDLHSSVFHHEEQGVPLFHIEDLSHGLGYNHPVFWPKARTVYLLTFWATIRHRDTLSPDVSQKMSAFLVTCLTKKVLGLITLLFFLPKVG